MAKYFAMRFQCVYHGETIEDGLADIELRSSDADWYFVGDDFGTYADDSKLYIHPDDELILFPQVGDLMVGPSLMCVEPFFVDHHMLLSPRQLDVTLLKGKCVSRKNVPFIWPDKEES